MDREWGSKPGAAATAIAAISKARQYPEDYVGDFFKKPMYALTYKEMVYPVPGQHDWVKTDSVDIEPPIFHSKPGRKKKKRRPSAGEGPDGTTRMTTITCSNCKLKGHRYTTCTQPLKPHLAIRKAGHKSNRQLPEYMEAPADPASPTPDQAPSAPPPQAAAPAPQPPAPRPATAAPSPQQAAATPRQPPAARRQAPAAPPQPQDAFQQAPTTPRQPPAAPQQAPAPPRPKLTSLRRRRRTSHYTETRLYGYFTASNGQGQQEEEEQEEN